MVHIDRLSLVPVLCVLGLFLPWCVQASGDEVEPVDLRAEDLAAFQGIHWHAFDYTLAEAPEIIGYDLLVGAEGKLKVVPGLSAKSNSAQALRHRFVVLYRESADRAKLDIAVKFDDFSTREEIDNPFVGESIITLRPSTVDPNGRMILALTLPPGDTRVSPENMVPEAAHRCLAIRIRTDHEVAALAFEARQKQLFYEIDHEGVYESCQRLMCSQRQGELTASSFHYDDPPEKLAQVPQAIRDIEPTSIAVSEFMVTLLFFSEEGTQQLLCVSNEFGEPPTEQDSKGFGFRKDPFAMDKLIGDESLDSLNETYVHFEMDLFPGLRYQYYGDESARTRDAVKQSAEGIAGMLDMVREMAMELAVKRQRLLYRVDHQKLLEACRVTIGRYREGRFSSAWIHLVPRKFKDDLQGTEEYEQSEANAQHIPEIILSLEPGYLRFTDTSVMVAIAGGLDHAGVIAYVKGEELELQDDEMKLIDGLVYYDDGLREADEDYREYLQSLRDEVMLYLDWKRKQMALPLAKRSDAP